MSKFNRNLLKRTLGGYSEKLQVLALLPLARAATYPSPPKDITSGNQFINAIVNVSGFLFQVFIALAIIFIIVAALFYLTAAGNQTQLDRAKNVLIYSIVAIVIALLAGGITAFIGDVADVKVPAGPQLGK